MLRELRPFITVLQMLAIAGLVCCSLPAGAAVVQVSAPSYRRSSGDFGPSYQAGPRFGRIAIDGAGNIYTADSTSLRKVTDRIVPILGVGYGAGYMYLPPGVRTPSLLKDVQLVQAFAVGRTGDLFVAAYDGGFHIFRVAPDGQLEVYANWHYNPIALAADGEGNLYVLDFDFFSVSGTRILKIRPDRTVVPVAGAGRAGYSGDNGPATEAQISASDLAADNSGNLFIADTGNYLIRKVDAAGIITKVAQGTAPITVDGSGNLFYFLRDGTLQRLAPDGRIDPIATVAAPTGIAVNAAGEIYVTSGGRLYQLDASGGKRLISGCGCAGDGGPVTQASILSAAGVARDAAGNVYFSDLGNHTVRRVAPDGIVTRVAGTGEPGDSGDNGPAISAQVSSPSGLAVDAAGNLYIADRGNSRIRKVTADGIIRTVAGNGVAGFSGDGGPATAARLAQPDGVIVDPAGNIFIADTANHRIRKVDPAGNIQTIAGSDSFGTSGDGGPASSALLVNPRALAFDLDGSLLFTDSSAHMVRRITTAGIIERVSGTGAAGSSGDGGPAVAARNWTPWGLAVDTNGNILISDNGTYRLRVVDRSGTIRTMLQPVIAATGLAPDPAGNVWIAGGSLSVLTTAGPPIPLAPVIYDQGVANSFSGQSGVIAPGEMVSITGAYLGPYPPVSATADGKLPTELGGVQVFFSGIAAPLLHVTDSRIDAIVPFGIAGKSLVDVTVEYAGAASNASPIAVLPAVPGLLNQYLDAIELTPPAPGAVISIFATGAGVMVPPQPDGQIGSATTSIPALPVTASLGTLPVYDSSDPWLPLEVTYAGSANWLVAGAIQVNVKLPAELPKSNGRLPIAIKVGDSLSHFVYLYVPPR